MKGLALFVLVGALLTAGCHKMVVTGEHGEKAEIDMNDKGFNVTDDKGNKMSLGTDEASEAELGVPFYPGSASQLGGMKMDTPDGSMVTSMRTTPDAIDKVLDFYKSEFAKAGYTVAGTFTSGDTGTISAKKGEDVLSCSVNHDTSKNQCVISVSNIKKKGGSSPSPSPAPSDSPSPSPSESPSVVASPSPSPSASPS